jgi:hypothetical protein
MVIKTVDDMLKIISKHGRTLSEFKKGDTITVENKMRSGYRYILAEDPGKAFDKDFKPDLSPADILRLGAFEGKYLNDCVTEFPAEWFIDAIALNKLSPGKPDVKINAFQIYSRQSLSVWRENDWAPHKGGKDILGSPETNPDERGWFQWYCRYWLGRRIPSLDKVQIKRWKAFNRHIGQIKKNCTPGDLECRPRQRQALLHWAHNPFI